MSGMALGLVLAAAFLHATWNYLTKKSQVKLVFIWWFLLISVLLYFPLFLYFWTRTTITSVGWTCIIATSILHALYFGFLGQAYEEGDLSIVYPLARGMGPFLVPFFAVGLIKEQLSLLGIMGIGLIILGIYILHLTSFSKTTFLQPFIRLKDRSSRWALGTGVTIALYSLVDKIGVGHVYPPVYIYLMFVGAFILLSPYILMKKRLLLFEEWQKNKHTILAVGFLALFTYLLVLFAMQMSKVSYIVALRETGILFSALYGAFWLREGHVRQKIVGAILIFCGVFSIGFSK
jgi:drug/metabolite transporter (DMT)-like permease